MKVLSFPKSPHALRVLLVDDHALMREGLRSCLSGVPHLEVVGEAADGRTALESVRQLQPDLVLMDLNLPHLGGLPTTTAILRQSPQVRVIVLTVHHQREYVVESIAAGARGFLSKDVTSSELIRVIEKVGAGGTHFELEDTVQYLRHHHALAAPKAPMATGKTLTAREQEVLRGVTNGESNRVIAARLGVGVRTVETYRQRLMRKLDIHTVAGLTRYALAHDLSVSRSRTD